MVAHLCSETTTEIETATRLQLFVSCQKKVHSIPALLAARLCNGTDAATLEADVGTVIAVLGAHVSNVEANPPALAALSWPQLQLVDGHYLEAGMNHFGLTYLGNSGECLFFL